MIPIVLAALVSLVSGASTPPPGQCCGPRKYSATMLEFGGTYVIQTGATRAEDNTMMLNYDYDRKMSHIMINSKDLTTGLMTNTSVLNDHKNGKTYALAADGHCYVQYLNPNLLIDPCGSPNFTMRGQFKIGSPSSPISIVQLTGMYGNYEMAITITADDCIPVTQTLYGYSEDKSSTGLYAFLFTDLKNNMVDDSLFTVPAACSAPVTIPVGKRHLEAVVGRPLPL